MGSSSTLSLVVLALAALVATVACGGGGGGGGTIGFSGAAVSSGSAAMTDTGPVFMDASNVTYFAGILQNGNIGYGTLSVSVVNQAIYVGKRAASGTFSYLKAFETVNAGDYVKATGIVTDSTGKTTVVAHVLGALRVNASLVLTGASGFYSVVVIQLDASGNVLLALISTNTGHATAGTAVLEANDAVGILGLGTGSFTLAGQTLTSLSSNTFYVRLSSTGAGVAKQKGSVTGAAWGSCYNSANSRTYVVGSAGNKFYIAGIDSAANWQGPYVSTFSGPATVQSTATGFAVVCLGSTVRMSGSLQTEAGVTMPIAGSSLASSQAGTFTALFDASTLSPLSANQGVSTSGAYGRGLVKTPAGVVFGTGDVLGVISFSGVALPGYSPNYSVYLTSIDSSSNYVNASVADATKGQTLMTGMTMGVNSNKFVLFVKVTGTVKYGAISVGAGSALVDYTVA